MINYLIAGTIILFTKLYYLNDRKIVDNILKLTNINITDNLKNENINLKINNNNFYKKVVSRGELGLAESYMDGDWETNNLELFLKELIENQDKIESKIYNINFLFLKLKNYLINSFKVKNKRGEVDKNVSHHYDIGNDLYSKMLDKNMQYTCAYFDKDYETLDEAQLSKMKLIAKKLNLKEGMEILDIGCGFGGLANYLANNYNVKVTGVTLSQKQIDFYNEKFKNDNVNMIYSDYRDINGSYDRVYSIGMFEQVGKKLSRIL